MHFLAEYMDLHIARTAVSLLVREGHAHSCRYISANRSLETDFSKGKWPKAYNAGINASPRGLLHVEDEFCTMMNACGATRPCHRYKHYWVAPLPCGQEPQYGKSAASQGLGEERVSQGAQPILLRSP